MAISSGTGSSDFRSPFRVIVVGAGVAGLATAHALHRAGIDYTVLERRTDVAPLMGSAIAIFPNGARILHQIGCLEELKATSTPCTNAWTLDSDGGVIKKSDLFRYVKENHGSDLLLLERRQLLQTLYDRLPDPSRVQLGYPVISIEQGQHGVEVLLADGRKEKGHIVIGADGVRSPTRSIMWDHANKAHPGTITAKEKTCMKTKWKVLIGMGPPAPELGDHDQTVCHNKDFSFMNLTQPNHTFFSCFFKLKEEVSWPRQQRYSAEDADAAAATVADLPVCDSLVFGELWRKRQRGALIGLEEGVLDHWYHGRIVLVGDCVHKMTPNSGLGGNTTLESVAVLCNQLNAITRASSAATSSEPSLPSISELNSAFAAYQKARHARVRQIVAFSSEVTNMHAWTTSYRRFQTRILLPFQNDRSGADLYAAMIRVAPKLDYVDTRDFPGGRVGWGDANLGAEAWKGMDLEREAQGAGDVGWKAGMSALLVCIMALYAARYEYVSQFLLRIL